MISIKINQKLTKNQRKALKCMKIIAKARDKLRKINYMRNLKSGEPGKKYSLNSLKVLFARH
jgi:hypothetical protein